MATPKISARAKRRINRWIEQLSLIAMAIVIPLLMVLAYPPGQDWDQGLAEKFTNFVDRDGAIRYLFQHNPGAIWGVLALGISLNSYALSIANRRFPVPRQSELVAADRFTSWCAVWLPAVYGSLQNCRSLLEEASPTVEVIILRDAVEAAELLQDNFGNGETQWGNIRTSEARALFPTFFFDVYIAVSVSAAQFVETYGERDVSREISYSLRSALEVLIVQLDQLQIELLAFQRGSWLDHPYD